VAATADRHPWIADLAASFPALLLALAVPRRGFDPEPILTAAAAGASLKQLAADAGVPLWLRALSPECFVRALPGCYAPDCAPPCASASGSYHRASANRAVTGAL